MEKEAFSKPLYQQVMTPVYLRNAKLINLFHISNKI